MLKSRSLRRGQSGAISTLDFLYNRAYMSPSISDQLTDRYRDSRMLDPDRIKFKMDLVGHYGCVNAIEFSNLGGQWIGSGGDDKRVLMWNTERAIDGLCQPVEMIGEHNSNIFCLAFDNENTKIFSGGNDEQVVVHDIETKRTLEVFLHKDAIYGLAVDPNNSNVFASACDDGRVLVCDIRLPPSDDPFVLANYMSAMHSVEYNPVDPRILATANASEGIALWDIRQPGSCLMRYGGALISQSCMSVRFNYRGDQLLALRRRLPPVLYSLHSAAALCQFDSNGYHNSCTMKSCSFAGTRDQYVLSGSDDFKLYMWKIPEDLSTFQSVKEAHVVLKGHRSIVNQVRYNSDNSLIISSGVEKIIKAWSSFNADADDTNSDATADAEKPQPELSRDEIDEMILSDGPSIAHDYSQRSTSEDPRMIAFFDSLVRREREEGDVGGDLNSDLDIATGYVDDFVHTDLSLDSSSDDSSNSSNMSYFVRRNRDMLVNVRTWQRNRRRRRIGLDYDDDDDDDDDENESENFWDLDSSSESNISSTNSSSSSNSSSLNIGEVGLETDKKEEKTSKTEFNRNESSVEQSANENTTEANSDSTKRVTSNCTKTMINSDDILNKRSNLNSDSSDNALVNLSQPLSVEPQASSTTDLRNDRKKQQESKSEASRTSLCRKRQHNSSESSSSSSDSESSETPADKKQQYNDRKLKKISSYRHLRKRHSSHKKTSTNNSDGVSSASCGDSLACESSASTDNEKVSTELNEKILTELNSEGLTCSPPNKCTTSCVPVESPATASCLKNGQTNGESSKIDETSQACSSDKTSDSVKVDVSPGCSNSDSYNDKQSAEVVHKFTMSRLKRLRSQAMNSDYNDTVELFGQKKTAVHCFDDNTTTSTGSVKSCVKGKLKKDVSIGETASSTADMGSCGLNTATGTVLARLDTCTNEKSAVLETSSTSSNTTRVKHSDNESTHSRP